jgi:hypothetical protein
MMFSIRIFSWLPSTNTFLARLIRATDDAEEKQKQKDKYVSFVNIFDSNPGVTSVHKTNE